LCEKRISEEDLRGLREDKMNSIRSFAKFLGESAAGLCILSAIACLRQLRESPVQRCMI
jgi:hypothetical protein